MDDQISICPFDYTDADVGRLRLSSSERYHVLSINDLHLYFIPETGAFDGWSQDAEDGEAFSGSRH